jgi:hypothetical protein
MCSKGKSHHILIILVFAVIVLTYMSLHVYSKSCFTCEHSAKCLQAFLQTMSCGVYTHMCCRVLLCCASLFICLQHEYIQVVSLSALSPIQLQKVYVKFTKELYILSKLQHPRIVTVYGCATTVEELTLVMEVSALYIHLMT